VQRLERDVVHGDREYVDTPDPGADVVDAPELSLQSEREPVLKAEENARASTLPSDWRTIYVAELRPIQATAESAWKEFEVQAWRSAKVSDELDASSSSAIKLYRLDSEGAITASKKITHDQFGELQRSRPITVINAVLPQASLSSVADMVVEIFPQKTAEFAYLESDILRVPRKLQGDFCPVISKARYPGASAISIPGLHADADYIASFQPIPPPGGCVDFRFAPHYFSGASESTASGTVSPVISIRFIPGLATTHLGAFGTMTISSEGKGVVYSQELSELISCLDTTGIPDGDYDLAAAGGDWVSGDQPVAFSIVNGIPDPTQITLHAQKSTPAEVIIDLSASDLEGAQVFCGRGDSTELKRYPTHRSANGSGVLRWRGSSLRLLELDAPVEVLLFVPKKSWLGLLPIKPGEIGYRSIERPSALAAKRIRETAANAIKMKSGADYVRIIAMLGGPGEPQSEVAISGFNLAIASNSDVGRWSISGYDHLRYRVDISREGAVFAYKVAEQ
jgi:hypothetical protein